MCQSAVFSLDLGPESVCSSGLSLVDNDLFEVCPVAASAEPRHVMLLVYVLLHAAPTLIGKLMGLRLGLLGDHNSVTYRQVGILDARIPLLNVHTQLARYPAEVLQTDCFYGHHAGGFRPPIKHFTHNQ